MPISIGSRLGPFEIVSAIGAGGMGEVYRARDTKLGRDVAIKVLPEIFTRDPERKARFQREAKLLGSLNHPNIAAVYGVEDSGTSEALVMELVEGSTLTERIATGPIAMDDALHIARQIADALEYAHERAVIHRDLKPANVKLASDDTVKVLDFGLAKAVQGEASASDATNSPTLTHMATQAGILLGTAAYMSPEQAKAKPVDRRADIWAFGCVLYEMLTGRLAFRGESVTDVLAAVIRSEPDWSQLPTATPLPVRVLLQRCLRKNPKQRLRDIGDARVALDEVLSGSPEELPGYNTSGSTSRFPGRVLPWVLATASLLLAASTAYLLLKPANPRPTLRFNVFPPENSNFSSGEGMMSLSPDGRHLAFVAGSSTGGYQLWIRSLDTLVAEPLPGTAGASWPFWSPSGKYLGFYADGSLKKVAASGGPVQALCPASPLSASWNTAGATWNQTGTILFSSDSKLYQVPEAGGASSLVATPDTAKGEVAYAKPQFLPDGRRFLLGVKILNAVPYTAVGSLDSRKIQNLPGINSEATYAAPGYLLYTQGGELLARAFDSRRLLFSGESFPVEGNDGKNSSSTGITASQNGILAFETVPSTGQDQMVWFSRKGEKLGTVGPPDFYEAPIISPDGIKLAVALVKPTAGVGDIWVYDLKRGAASRLTFSGTNIDPLWSPDGKRIFFASNRTGPQGIYSKTADGLGPTQSVYQLSQQPMWIDSISQDGRYAMCFSSAPTASVWLLPLFGERTPSPFVQGNSFAASRPRISPDDRYVAYNSDETGGEEIYVQTFPQHSGKWQISTSGGSDPMWRADGKELFYLSPNNQLMAVPISADSKGFQAGVPQPLFQAQLVNWIVRNLYTVSPDGQRFLMLVPAGETKPSAISVVVNWPDLLTSTTK